MKRWRFIILGLLVLAVVGFYLYRDRSGNGFGKSGPLILYGNVDVRTVPLAFRIGGRLAQVHFDEGDRIHPGDVVARLDATPVADELRRAQAQQAQAQAQLNRLVAGSRPQEIAQAQALVTERQATLANLERDYRRQRELVHSGAVARQVFDATTARRDEARARLNTARQALALAREGFRAEDIAAGRAAVQAAAAAVASARTRLADATLTAPAGGVLLTRAEEPGAMLAAGQPVGVLALDRPVWVRAYVDEPDLGRLHPGMKAEVVSDTDPAHPLPGQVGFISPEAEFTPKTVQTETLRTNLVYRVRVIVDDPAGRLRQGMPVTVRLPDTAAKGGE